MCGIMATKTLRRTAQFAPRLHIESGPHQGDEYLIRKPTILIGRHAACDLVVDEAQVSRRHCQVSWDGVYCTLEDLGSTNGTFVNGQPLTAAYVLRPGDKVQVASVVFQFIDPQATLVGHKWPKLKIERATRRVTVNGDPIALSAKEYTLLLYLDDHADRICSREEITTAVWPEYKGSVFDYQVESLIKRLRQKLEPDAEESHLVVTIRGRGYRLMKI
jgi:pSer/pThr/pTyr-binding forkhead associated (FHA) protein